MAASKGNPRIPEHEIDPMFIDRWSPRAYKDEPIPKHQLLSLFEAVRWTPSCYNEQPWRFVYTASIGDKVKFLSALSEKNQQWARHASVLAFALAKNTFSRNDKYNRHAPFDTGAAWMALALQARKFDLYAHAMAGFNRDKAYEILEVPETDFDIRVAIAIGKKSNIVDLPDDLASIEMPNNRKPVTETIFESIYKS